jgi:hypothetical protein
MPRKRKTSPIPAPLITQAFDELLPIIDEISDRFPAPGHPLAPALLQVINWTGRHQIKLKSWLEPSSKTRVRKDN